MILEAHEDQLSELLVAKRYGIPRGDIVTEIYGIVIVGLVGHVLVLVVFLLRHDCRDVESVMLEVVQG